MLNSFIYHRISKGNEVKIFTRDFNRWFERIIHEGTFTDIFKSLLIDDSETKRKILELAFKGAYSKGICLMNDYSCEDATDNSLALRNDLLCTKMLKKQLILGCFEASFNKLIISTKNKDHDLDLWRNLVAMGCHIRNILELILAKYFIGMVVTMDILPSLMNLDTSFAIDYLSLKIYHMLI